MSAVKIAEGCKTQHGNGKTQRRRKKEMQIENERREKVYERKQRNKTEET